MSNTTLIIGESGTGKSTSLRNLDPEETFIINILDKPLPFRGYKAKYKAISKDNPEGNYYATDDFGMVIRAVRSINDKRPEIKVLIIDDFGYTITNSFMRKANQTGFQKFNDLGKDTFELLEAIKILRDDLYCFVMMHTEIDMNGRYKPKTVGKMIDQHICIEGKFTYVFHALVIDSQYKFLTNNDGIHMAKTPYGMFAEKFIDNDLSYVLEKIKEYSQEERK